MPLPPRLPWQHPWLTVQFLLRRILTEPWSDEAWREIRQQIPTVVRERERIRREGMGHEAYRFDTITSGGIP